ncbi:helix-turn-helix domain-containing protein [Streptomyces sp. CA-210063]|uniref:helix-turn-helix domain-containing protein n=1 Tax=Streptomyces sp. CA-210063 TaxID=2801029 RepID=UPI00214A8DE5|nr:helix-turn-helix domain-containing protein [Streptomyces sp. CA-210063]UUU33182.1 helix-turn-helix domain-containing protein [Streptomyces sp. CA-210063]
MAESQPSAPARAKSPHPGSVPGSGVEHVNERHDTHFTVVGNHLAQHPELSLTAIGLATHIQSLPKGTPVGIKALAAKFREGEVRIASALRELEAHGYLKRLRERLPSGRIVTRTISYNNPHAEQSGREPKPVEADDTGDKEGDKPVPAHHEVDDEAEPRPTADSPQRRTAARLLADLRTYDSRLLLTERDVRRLTSAVVTWLERGVSPTAVLRALTEGLPEEPLRRPAAFLAHRLAVDLPPAVSPPRPPLSTTTAATALPARMQNCDGCDRGFRAHGPGRCRDCRRHAAERAVA